MHEATETRIQRIASLTPDKVSSEDLLWMIAVVRTVQESAELQHDLNIGNICGGVVPERFDYLLDKVAQNIADVNAAQDETRSITLTFKFKPYTDRTGFNIKLEDKVKLAGRDARDGQSYLIRDGKGKAKAFVHDVRQLSLTMQPVSDTKN